jgi:hypothetical protein
VIPVVLLGHGVLAAACMAARLLPGTARTRVATGAALAGAVFGAGQVALWDTGEMWRSATLDRDAAPIAGGAALVAWVIVATLQPSSDRWWAGAFTGVAAAGLGMFASNGWLVPSLLFWAVGSAALVGLVVRSNGGLVALASIVVSDVLLVTSVTVPAFDDDKWILPSSPSSGWFWMLAAAAVVRGGALPVLHGLTSGPARPALPLLTGGGLTVAAGVGGRSEPWLATALIAAAVLWAALAAGRRAPSVALPCAGLAAFGAGVIYAAADAAGAAGLAVAMGTGGLLIAPASAASGLLVALVPLSPGSAALGVAAAISFRSAIDAPNAIASAPWAALAALLPIALAASVAVGGRVLRSADGSERQSVEVAAALLALAAVAATLAGVGAPSSAPSDREVLTAAIGAGSVAAVLGATRGKSRPPHVREPFATGSGFTLNRRPARIVGLVLSAVFIAEVTVIVGVTIAGMRAGFL